MKLTQLIYGKLFVPCVLTIYQVAEQRVMVFNATFNNISVISWQPVLLVEETRVPGENQTCSKSLTNFVT